jgi:hypothetical protein
MCTLVNEKNKKTSLADYMMIDVKHQWLIFCGNILSSFTQY